MTTFPPPPPPAHLAHLAAPVAVPPPPGRVRVVMDIECYRDYFLVMFKRASDRQVCGVFEAFPSCPLDVEALRRFMHVVTIVTFNGNHYDAPMLAAALQGFDCSQLKWLSDKIITQNLNPWDLEREYKIYVPSYFDHIDLIEILPGQHGLKMYMAKMHSRRIQELPIEPSASITPEMRPLMREYCGNDLEGNVDALELFASEIKLREEMSREYGIDLRSKSDAQIAEAVIKHELGFRVERPEWAVGTYFMFDVPAFIRYQTPMMQDLLAMVKQARFVLGPNAVDMPPELEAAKIKIGSTTYKLGLGGLHSQEASVYHVTDAAHELQDVDVESYYPRLMLNSGAYPPQMGESFRTVFNTIVERRIAAKNAGDKKTADSLKITINGTFGKTLSKYGILSAPKLGIQTTLSGQLSILMLIEMLELVGIPVVSANTDGIVIKCPRPLLWLRDQLVKAWCAQTGLKTEAVVYSAIFFQSVNSYVAFKAPTETEPNPKPKLKGEYAASVPIGGSWPNPTGFVCVEAVVAYLQHGTPLLATIRACTDVRKFVYVRNVKGGGVKYYGGEVEKVTTKGGMRFQLAQAGWIEVEKDWFSYGGAPRTDDTRYMRALPMKEAYPLALQHLRETNPVKKEYVGKVVRWYYAKDMPGAIRYLSNGNLVPKTEGAKPLMILPDALPDDIDYAWYEREAKSLVADLGVAII